MSIKRVPTWLLTLFVLIYASFAHGNILTETIYEDGFEETRLEVFPRIEFLSDRNVVFSSVGQSRGLEVRVYDADGQVVPSPTIVWQSALPGVVSVSPGAPGTANVQSAAAWTSPISLTASYSPLGLAIDAKAVFATLAPRTVLIESGWVQSILGDRGVAHSIRLQRNPVTAALTANDIVVSGDYAGIVVRVLSIQFGANSVNLSVEPALITQAFQQIEFAGEGEPLLLRLRIEGDRGELTLSSKRTGAQLQRKSLSKANIIDMLQCGGGFAGSGGLDIDFMSFEQSLVPRGGLRIENSTVVEFLLAIEGSAGIETGVSFALTGSFNVEGSCDARFPSFALGWFPFLGPVAVSLDAVPTAGISASVGGSGSLSTEAIVERHWSFSAGVRYTNAAGWTTIADSNVVGSTLDNPFNATGAFNARIDVTAGVAAETGFSLGVPAFNFNLLGMRLATLEGGPYLAWSLPLPINPAQAAYQGPSSTAGVNATGRLGFKRQLFEGHLARYLPLTLSADLTATFLNENLVLGSLPAVTGQITCAPSCQSLAPGTGQISANLAALTTETGTAQFYIGLDGQPMLSLLGSANFNNGAATLQATVPAVLVPGSYRVYGRLRLNGPLANLTGVFPLAPAAALGQATIGQATGGALNDTGQSSCATATNGLLGCPQPEFPDQDGDHGRDARARLGQLTKVGAGEAGFDYSKISNSGTVLSASAVLGNGPNDWGCTRDNVTGLIWEVKTNNLGSLRHMAHTYTWYSSDASINGGDPGTLGTSATCSSTLAQCNTQAYVAAVNAQGLCGANNWRMPTPQELQGIVHYGRFNPAIDPVYFVNTATSGNAQTVWTGRSLASNASGAWFVGFDGGGVGSFGKPFGNGVRLVRAGQ
jgi:hypothetical protein